MNKIVIHKEKGGGQISAKEKKIEEREREKVETKGTQRDTQGGTHTTLSLTHQGHAWPGPPASAAVMPRAALQLHMTFLLSVEPSARRRRDDTTRKTHTRGGFYAMWVLFNVFRQGGGGGGGAGDGNQPSQLPTLPALRCSWGAERSRTRPSRRARLFREARNAFRDTEWERGEEAAKH